MRNITGQRFGKLLAIKQAYVKTYPRQTKAYWLCSCECGNKRIIRAEHLYRGATLSCGCIKKNNAKTHGLSQSSEYGAWIGMRQRLKSKEAHKVKSYTGIGYEESWDKFENFLRDMGSKPTPKHELDRINPFNSYCKENCRWATRVEQMNNLKKQYQ